MKKKVSLLKIEIDRIEIGTILIQEQCGKMKIIFHSLSRESDLQFKILCKKVPFTEIF